MGSEMCIRDRYNICSAHRSPLTLQAINPTVQIHFCRRWANLPRQWLLIPVRREHPVVCHSIGDYSMEGPLKLPVLSRTLPLGAVVKCSLQISPERRWPHPIVLRLLLTIVRGFHSPYRTAGGMVSVISTVFRPVGNLSLLHKGSVRCGTLSIRKHTGADVHSS